ncbi:MAG: ABC transporter substrate-binding protein [Cyanobacteria bacterium P01_A01_bin.83]
MKKYNPRLLLVLKLLALVSLGILTAGCDHNLAQSPGVTKKKIHLGSVLVLQGQDEAIGNGMRLGIEAALAGERVQGRSLEISFKNDYYEPASARQATLELLEEEDIFLALGNVGTPTAKLTLPILTQHNIPAVGFFTGARLLRENASPLIVNYRASYEQEIATVIKMALAAGVTPEEVCAYIQNDSYGLDALENLKQTLAQAGASKEIIAGYDQVLQATGDYPSGTLRDRNNIGPVGIYTRNTLKSEPGYNSLKNWESQSGNKCKLVVTAATYRNLTYFAKKSQEEANKWIISALSFTGADELRWDLSEYNVTEGVIMTQVVPLLNSELPIVKSARSALGKNLGVISLEGYVVGKMVLKILRDIPGELTTENFLQQVQKSRFNLGGIPIDFTDGDNQGADLIIVSQIKPEGFQKIELLDFASMVK